MKPGDAIAADRLQLLVLRRRVHHQRREELLQHVAVLLQHQLEELLRVVGHQVDLDAVVDARLLDRLLARFQADDLVQRQQVNAAQVEVRVGRREPIQVRAADRRE